MMTSRRRPPKPGRLRPALRRLANSAPSLLRLSQSGVSSALFRWTAALAGKPLWPGRPKLAQTLVVQPWGPRLRQPGPNRQLNAGAYRAPPGLLLPFRSA
jgi:hypothetical protein